MPINTATDPIRTCTTLAVHADAEHRFSKPTVPSIRLLPGLGVEGDAHCGQQVQHRSRVQADPTQPNLRQVHLISASLLTYLQSHGFAVPPGGLGENITVGDAPGLHWQDWIALPRGTQLQFGEVGPCLELTGLRNPCHQIDAYQPGLLAALLGRDAAGQLIRKAGVMAVVVRGGNVCAGDAITVHQPKLPHLPMERV